MIARINEGVASAAQGAPALGQAASTASSSAFQEVWATAIAETVEDLPSTLPAAGEIGSGALQTRVASLMRDRDGLEGSLMMLCMLMSQGAGGLNPMVATLSAMVALLSREDALELWKKTMDSDYSPEVLDQVDEEVFQSQFASATPYQSWRPSESGVVSPAENRDSAVYREVIDQFDVVNNPRYTPNKKGTNDTYCNIFTWDVTRAMDAEIPHYTDPETGDIRTYPDTKDALRMTANRTYDWLAEHGERYGWYRATAEEAQLAANRGQPAVTVLKRPGAHGHLQMVCPSVDGQYDPARGVSVAQAGSRLTEYDYLNDITSASTRDQIAYYVHA